MAGTRLGPPGRDLTIFDWFVPSMRMQVILNSPFARPGSAPIWGGKKGEFRDWTRPGGTVYIGFRTVYKRVFLPERDH